MKRYDYWFSETVESADVEMIEDADGDYVLYSDHCAEVERLKEIICRVKNVRRHSNGMVSPSSIIAEIEATGHFRCPHDKEVERLKEHNRLLLAVAEMASNYYLWWWGDDRSSAKTGLKELLDQAKAGGAMP